MTSASSATVVIMNTRPPNDVGICAAFSVSNCGYKAPNPRAMALIANVSRTMVPMPTPIMKGDALSSTLVKMVITNARMRSGTVPVQYLDHNSARRSSGLDRAGGVDADSSGGGDRVPEPRGRRPVAPLLGYGVRGGQHRAGRPVRCGHWQRDPRAAAHAGRLVRVDPVHGLHGSPAGGDPGLVHGAHRRLRAGGAGRARRRLLGLAHGWPGAPARGAAGAPGVRAAGGIVAGGHAGDPRGEPRAASGTAWPAIGVAGLVGGCGRTGDGNRGDVAPEAPGCVPGFVRVARRDAGGHGIVHVSDSPAGGVGRGALAHGAQRGQYDVWSTYGAELVGDRFSDRRRLLRGAVPDPSEQGDGGA